MDNRIAAVANALAYDTEATRKYVDGAPHVKHASLREAYSRLVVQIYDRAARHTRVPRVLDLGAGEGLATMPLLQLGAHVTAVDISPSQLDALSARCAPYGAKLVTRCEDIADTLRRTEPPYDVVACMSFLHHVPDYLGMIRDAVGLLAPHGQFFSFQDPLRYDSVGMMSHAFSDAVYLSWRVFRGDVWGGLVRRLRRSRGIYHADSVHDSAEYHVVRNGVDQDAITELLENLGCMCQIIPYFSTQSRLFQPLGARIGVKNTFAVIAEKSPMPNTGRERS